MDEPDAATTRVRDGRAWRIGDAADGAWITQETTVGVTIASAIPPVFEAYATIVVPGLRDDRDEHDRALLAVLARHSPEPWWLGYLDTGADDVVFRDAPMTTLYTGWRYVLVEAGPQQAASWKDPSSWRGSLPDVMFPADRSWLVSTLWDDEWRCLGGPAALIEALMRDPHLDARRVGLDDDVTPPGYVAR